MKHCACWQRASLREFGDLVAARITPVTPDNIGQRSPRHGRLLGGQCKAEDLQQQKTDGVVGPYQNRFRKGRPVLADEMKFDGRRKDSKKSASDSRAPHLPVFLAAMGDVVFATVAGTFHRLARQQVEILPDERGDTYILTQAMHQGVQ
jgi:hypothetical protein